MFRTCCVNQNVALDEPTCTLSQQVAYCSSVASLAAKINSPRDRGELPDTTCDIASLATSEKHYRSYDMPTENLPGQLSMTIQKAPTAKWGIDIEWRNRSNLRICRVKEGAIYQWNVKNPALALEAEDVILEINGVINDAEGLVQQISTSSTIELRVQKHSESRRRSSSHTTFSEMQSEFSAVSTLASIMEHFQPVDAFEGHRVFNVNFLEQGVMRESVQHYLECCTNSSSLFVTTSCSSAWSAAGEINRFGKVVPAIPRRSEGKSLGPSRVFVFDSQLNLKSGGSQSSTGCCNLRDAETGKFVDYSADQNAFCCSKVFAHTLVHHSEDYNNILVQVSIIDAMANADYFSRIVKMYSTPSDKLLVFTDVHGTLIWDKMFESSRCSDLSLSEILLHSMFRSILARPISGEAASIIWETQELALTEEESLLSLVKRALNKDADSYKQFWSFKRCKSFIHAVAEVAEMSWCEQKAVLTTNQFFIEYTQVLDSLRRSGAGVGVAESWLRCYKELSHQGHPVVINSFSPDAQRILGHMVPDVKSVPQFLVNYDLWRQHEKDQLSTYFQK